MCCHLTPLAGVARGGRRGGRGGRRPARVAAPFLSRPPAGLSLAWPFRTRAQHSPARHGPSPSGDEARKAEGLLWAERPSLCSTRRRRPPAGPATGGHRATSASGNAAGFSGLVAPSTSKGPEPRGGAPAPCTEVGEPVRLTVSVTCHRSVTKINKSPNQEGGPEGRDPRGLSPEFLGRGGRAPGLRAAALWGPARRRPDAAVGVCRGRGPGPRVRLTHADAPAPPTSTSFCRRSEVVKAD